ncbi:zinc-binding dehydrogenase [Exiguobacterium antarcticum]|uniref:zinc-binding dehydrogenase n=1 Tax=Exiguobacterium antarcticum TaxID=132920 RepID=UPI000285EFCC|nr:zinc-binding dehydrogenase [Exiguobacterium antarcticum]AFS71847.1 Alcohol dehydrogenase zinc-binding domain protein [Exiguobacterium antarcticum B7]
MKAFVVEQYGKDATLTEKDVTLNQTGNYDVRINVEGTSLNPLDTKMFFGHVAAAPSTGILQGDVTGTIVEIGESVTSFSVGDHVIAFGGGLGNRSGALAEEMLVPENMAVHRPDNLDIAAAGCLPVISLTAMEALKERATVQPGMRLYVAGGTGGVGHLVGQLAKHYGCDVTASAANDEKAAWLDKHGIHPHRYREESAEQLLTRLGHDGFDVIIDTVGGDHLQESFILAKERGKIISIATRTTQDLTMMHSKALTLEAVFVALPLLKGKEQEMIRQREHLAEVAKLVADGVIDLVIEEHVPRQVDALNAAYQTFDRQSHFGKVSITK